MPEKVPEKMPGECLTKLSMTAPGGLGSCAVDEALALLSVKVEAAVGLRGAGLELMGPAEQTGAVARKGEPGCGEPQGKEGEGACGDPCSEWELSREEGSQQFVAGMLLDGTEGFCEFSEVLGP